jgi:hypothetical protein
MYQDEELHAELLRLFREYFEANQRWINEGTKRAGMDTREALRQIRIICTERRKHIMEWRRWKNIDMAEKKAKKAAAQNDSDKDPDPAN